jgi:hypothetical protein
MFLKAARQKIRFDSPKGLLGVEDLWDLPLTSQTGKANLDDMARDISRRLKAEDVSFVVKERNGDVTLQLKFDLVKFVIDTLLTERDTAAKARLNAEKKQQLLALIAQKENEQLAGNSLEEFRKMVEAY